MRVVALEEHYTAPHITGRIPREAVHARGFRQRTPPKAGPSPVELLQEIGERRLKSMDESGITVEVLSLNGPGPDIVPGPDGIAMARELNDYLAEKIAANPARFAGLATLPVLEPDAAAREMERSVKELGFHGAMVSGLTDGLFLDHAKFDCLMAACVQLDVPLYIHPNVATEPVRQAYFYGLPQGQAGVLETGGWGWHSETAIHIIRLALTGVLDRHPKLKIIVGHMGEMLPVMLARIDHSFARDIDHLQRPISKAIVDQVWLTTSGLFTEPPFLAALQTFGIDRLMFSIDYPYAKHAQGRQFLDRVSLSPADMAKLTHGNADSILKLKPATA